MYVTVCVAVCCGVPQCVVVCCSVLQCVALCCIVLQFVACLLTDKQHSNVLQCVTGLLYVAVCCSVLQCVAVRATDHKALLWEMTSKDKALSLSLSVSSAGNDLKK